MRVRQIIIIILLSHIWRHIYPVLKNILEMESFSSSLPKEDEYLIITNKTFIVSEKMLYHP